jgi:hypothetical protein
MEIEELVDDSARRNRAIVEGARADAMRGRVDGVEAWRLPGGDVVAFPTPLVPFGEIRWVDKAFPPR